ncbi:hypothetical protein ACF3N7_07195 [Cruoricaptor ignavus]|uniref:hypothetical protein n=1 Tax=Cruoricaptor ignavus TaxID=1118202 RepID=UPI00370DB7E1
MSNSTILGAIAGDIIGSVYDDAFGQEVDITWVDDVPEYESESELKSLILELRNG